MLYWIAATILTIANGFCLFANLLLLPGNWMMLGTLCIFMLAVGTDTGPDAKTLLIVLALAIFAEIIEFFSGSAVASKQGASRRALLLSLAASFACSIAGAVLVPIPVVGSAVGAVTGAAFGAFAGAWIGEAWKGTTPSQRTSIGTAAAAGRMLGMFGKLLVGAAIFVFQLLSLW